MMNRIVCHCLSLLLLVFGACRVAAVSVSSFSPTYGSAGSTTLITIKGTGFYPGTIQVMFNETVSLYAEATTADGTTIQARVPAGATTGPITVSVYNVLTGVQSASSAENFVVIGNGPYVTGFSPASGGGATKVTLTGANFTGVTNVTFDGKNGTALAVTMDSTLTVYTPLGVTTGPIVVSSRQGSFTTSSNFWVPPVLTTLSPTFGRAGTNLLVRGTNFTGATSVLFAGTNGTFTLPGSFIVNSNRGLTVLVPTNAVTGKVRVITPAGSATSTNNFKMLPVIYSQSPASGAAGTVVTLKGANFNVGTPTVQFNGKAASALSGLSFGSVKATAPSGVTTGPISISTTDGGYTNLDYFYVPASITSLSASNSPPGSRITLSGANFIGATSVTFNGMPAAQFTVTNNTSMGVTVPPEVPTGPIILTTPAGSTASSRLFYGAPVITGFSPVHGLPGTNVTIYGTNLLGATGVWFNGKAASFTATNNGFLTATVPANADAGPIRVAAPGGTNTTLASFVIDSSDLAVSVTVSASPVFSGSNFTYTIRVANNGPADAPGVTLTNRLPAGVSLVAGQASQGSLNGGTAPVTASLGQINVGTECVVTLTARANAPGSLTNTVWVRSLQGDPAPLNNTNVTIVPVIPVPFLSIQSVGSQMRVSWPAALSNYLVQYVERLDTNQVWTNTTQAVIQSNDLNFIIETNNRPNRFYRLKGP